MRCLVFALLASTVRAELASLKWMAHNAAWGAANDKKYSPNHGEWEAHSARHTSHLDSLTDALGEDSPVLKHLDLMSIRAAWGAANERAYGASRSGSQVDWDEHRAQAGKLGTLVDRAFADKLEEAAKHAAWYAANKYTYGEGNADTAHSLQMFKEGIAAAKGLAPKEWPMKEVEAVFKYNSLKAAAHRAADMEKKKRKRHEDHGPIHYEETDTIRDDWKKFHDHAQSLAKELGPDQGELFDHLEGMVIEAAWGAANERTHGKHSNDAKVHWMKYRFHADEAVPLYKGKAKMEDIREMITSAAWGAANERAYGSAEAKKDWQRFEEAAARITSLHGGEL